MTQSKRGKLIGGLVNAKRYFRKSQAQYKYHSINMIFILCIYKYDIYTSTV